MIPVKHFYMIRHGETEANAAQIMAGSMDTPLTPNGRAQAKDIHTVLDHLPVRPEVIVHSHLSRARDTASIINEALGLPMHEDPDCGEMHTGDWEGAPYSVCTSLFRGWVEPPGGESVENFFSRVKRAKKAALHAHNVPLIVCHGGVFRAFWQLFGLSTMGVKNCKLYEFAPGNMNDAQHAGEFPWDVFRYDILSCGTVNRHQVDVTFKDPASEIA